MANTTTPLEHLDIERRVRGLGVFASPPHQGDTAVAGADGLERFLELAEQLAGVVAKLHAAGVRHGRIQPQHVVIRGGHVMLTGLDHAGPLVEELPDLAAVAAAPVIDPFQPPERTGHLNRPVDERADLYAVGATLYAFATGRSPFPETTGPDLLRAQLAGPCRPPAAFAAWMPQAVSRMILKLLAPEPADRYQTAAALREDLRHFRTAAATGSSWEDIRPVATDRSPRPRSPRRLHGREASGAALQAVFESVCRGSQEMLFVTGGPGVGKTSLVNELCRPVTLARGWFVRGKCEQFQGQPPLLPLAQAFGQLCRQLVVEADAGFAATGPSLAAALGGDAALLLDFVPDAADLFAVRPTMPETGPLEAERRLQLLLIRLLCLVTAHGRPVVFVLDDMHWADPPTLDFARRLLEARLPGVLFIGTFRNAGLDDNHPLRRLLELPNRSTRLPQVVSLDELPAGDMALLVADMLDERPEAVGPLATAISRATGGNPFFAIELLRLLSHTGLVIRDPASGRWQHDASGGDLGAGAAGLASLVRRTLENLPADTIEPLVAAACLGTECSLALLARVTGRRPEELAVRLWPAIASGVLVTPDAAALGHGAATAPVRFRHDSMLDAARRLVGPDRLTEFHLSIARNLAATGADEPTRFRAASHYAIAVEHVMTAVEQETARELFLSAAQTSRRAGGFAEAERFLKLALQLLPEEPWRRAATAAWEVHVEFHLICYSLANYAQADHAWEQLARHAPTPAALAEPACIQVMSLSNRTRYGEAVELGSGILRQLGREIPGDDLDDRLGEEVDAFERDVAGGVLARLPRRPSTGGTGPTDPATRLMNRMVPAAFFIRPALANWLVMAAARLWTRGDYDAALLYPMACSCLALIATRGNYRTGPQASQAALAIGEADERGVETARVRHVHGLLNVHWHAPLEDALAEAREAFEALLRHGELEFACYTFFTSQVATFETAANVAELAQEHRRGLDFACRTRNRHATGSYEAFRCLIAALAGPKDPATIADPDEGQLREGIASNPMARAFHHIYAAVAAAILGDDARLVRHAQAAATLATHITAFYPVALANLVDSLAAIATLRTGGDTPAIRARLEANQAWLGERAFDAEVNFRHLHDLVEAETLLATGHGHDALAVFERAMRRAAAHRRPWHLAFITERAGRCYLSLDLVQAGRRLLERSRDLYRNWGASRKVAQLEEAFSFLRQPPLLGHASGPGLGADTASLFAAAQSVAAARSLPQLVAATVAALRQVSGARDILLLARDQASGWMLLGGERAGRAVTAALPFSEAVRAGLVPNSVVEIGLRDRRPVASADAAADPALATDPHFAHLDHCSVLGVPVLVRGDPVAFIVLEHQGSRAAFGDGPTAAVGLLSGQLAVALENIRLNEVLTTEVAARTAQLREAERTLAQVAYEMTENIPVGTYIVERDDAGQPRFTFVSERWLRMLDLGREDVLEDASLAFRAVHPDDREAFARLNTEVLAEHRRFSWEGRIVVRGVTRWVSIESVPRQKPGGGTIWEGVMTDITQRIEAVEALSQSESRHRRQLEEKLRTSLEAAAVAHEIKQPLSRVLLQARLAERDPAGREAALAVIAAEARTVERTIEKMRVLLRSVETSHAPVDLRDVVTSSLLQVKWRLAEESIDVVRRGFTKLALVDGDDAQLQLAVTNLLRNAADAIAAGSRRIRRISLSLRRGPREVMLAIGDSGPGWSGVERRELPFSTTKPAGSGIGLYLVRTIAQHHACEVVFRRSADGGAEVRLRFPVSAGAANPPRGGRMGADPAGDDRRPPPSP